MHIFIIFGLLLLLLAYGPSVWVRRVMARHHQPVDRYPGTGAELARDLLQRLELPHVKVEETTSGGDHYDPRDRAVRLGPENYKGRSLTAISVAAHEVGHAIQHADGYQPLRWRTQLVMATRAAQRIGAALLLAAPLIMVITRMPGAGLLLFVGGVLTMGTAVLVHLVTLPTEVDASFRRALPLLEAGYLKPEDRPGARRILTAAAFTYVAAALGSLINVWAWLRLIRP
ncbi:zinc metallopeptidase [Natronocella acetinitrilica]|nr:zinc metallopeptidase [Natronocella acetinitrilica]